MVHAHVSELGCIQLITVTDSPKLDLSQEDGGSSLTAMGFAQDVQGTSGGAHHIWGAP